MAARPFSIAKKRDGNSPEKQKPAIPKKDADHNKQGRPAPWICVFRLLFKQEGCTVSAATQWPRFHRESLRKGGSKTILFYRVVTGLSSVLWSHTAVRACRPGIDRRKTAGKGREKIPYQDATRKE